MKKYLYLVFLMLLSNISHAQLPDNKFNLYVGYSFGNFPGSETINEDNYITPSLYSNYHIFSGFSIKGIINTKGLLSYGISYDKQYAHIWNSPGYSDFEKSEIRLHSFTPIVLLQIGFNETGPLKNFRGFLECGLPIGKSKLTLSQSLFDIKSIKFAVPPLYDESIFAGLRGTIGLEYSISLGANLFCSYSYDMNWVSSILYEDNSFKRSIVNVGLVFKLKKNKYYKYIYR